MYTTVLYDSHSCTLQYCNSMTLSHVLVGAAEHHPTNPVGELPSESGGETTGPAPGED